MNPIPKIELSQKYKTQVNQISKGQQKLNITRPAVFNDGIKRFDESNHNELLNHFHNASIAGRFMKFIPASGAATRMSGDLISIFNKENLLSELEDRAKDGDAQSDFAVKFINGIKDFAFYNVLEKKLKESNHSTEKLLAQREYRELFDFVLTKNGLNLSQLPKALLQFHKYENEIRTAFEEHIVESQKSLADIEKRIVLHFTISKDYQKEFEDLYSELKARYNDYQLDISFSYQDPETNTIALSKDGYVLTDDNGEILPRPGGHGTLLKNLNNLDADLVFIKNVDNVVYDRMNSDLDDYRKLLGGYLVYLQKQIFYLIQELIKESVNENILNNTQQFIENELCFIIRDSYKNYSDKFKKDYLLQILNRPIRVCGMVKNTGEPGGGPFWVVDKEGNESLQIVEQSQFYDDQLDILKSATHFNPVDIVCAMKTYSGRNFNLLNFKDDDAYLVSKKTYNGELINTLEYPGLWNGSMANWNTVFVEIPASTFHPVKEVNDLLKPEHQP